MKTIKNLNDATKMALRTPLENISPRTVNTIKDLRMIDRICLVMEAATDSVQLEDADFTFLKTRFDQFDGWNPKLRAVVIEASDKLNEATKPQEKV